MKVTIKKSGYIEVPDNLTVDEAIRYARACGEDSVVWAEPEWESLQPSPVMENKGGISTPLPQTPVLVTLIRNRVDGRDVRGYRDDYIIEVPNSVINTIGIDRPAQKKANVLVFAEQNLRDAAKALLLGPMCPSLLSQTSGDFNWGDFSQYFTGDAVPNLGVYTLQEYHKKGGVITSLHHVEVEVSQDESLVPEPDDVMAQLTCLYPDGQIVSVPAEVNFRSGEVVVDGGVNPGGEMMLNLGYGPSYPVASFDDTYDRRCELFFYLSE